MARRQGAIGPALKLLRSEDGRGSEVRITFQAASLQKPLRLLNAQTRYAALGAVIAEQDVRTKRKIEVSLLLLS